MAREMLDEVVSLVKEAKAALNHLAEVAEKGVELPSGRDQAVFYRDEVRSAMDALRSPIDKLEMIMDKEYWPMPSYGDLIFEV